jgi:hypothetical protein
VPSLESLRTYGLTPSPISILARHCDRSTEFRLAHEEIDREHSEENDGWLRNCGRKCRPQLIITADRQNIIEMGG